MIGRTRLTTISMQMTAAPMMISVHDKGVIILVAVVEGPPPEIPTGPTI
jgi:hypothetical protein